MIYVICVCKCHGNVNVILLNYLNNEIMKIAFHIYNNTPKVVQIIFRYLFYFYLLIYVYTNHTLFCTRNGYAIYAKN